MSKFRKRPVVVEAVQFFPELYPWPNGVHSEQDGLSASGKCFVVTIHGQRAYLDIGDWIIMEPDGEHFYPCKPDIFEATYEPVEA